MKFFDSIPQFLEDLEDHKVDYHAALIYFEMFKSWYSKQPLDGDDGIILKNAKRLLFDSFREHFPKFYVDHIYWKYDQLKETKKRFQENERQNDKELIELLEWFKQNWKIPEETTGYINKAIIKLSDEKTNQED